MEHEVIQYNSLLIIILLATLVPIFIKTIRFIPIPIVVGEVISGMIVGKSGLNIIEQSPWLNFLYAFGFAFLMFLSGLEVDFHRIKSLRHGRNSKWYKKPGLISILLFLGTISIGGAISYIFKILNLIQNVPLMTLILSTTSLGIVVPTLKEKGFLNTGFGQIILLSALIADFTTMILVTIYISFYTSAQTYKVALLLLLFVFFFIFYKIVQIIVRARIIEELAHETSQIKVRGAFLLILIFMALAQALGTEIILGAFLAGLVVSLLDKRYSSQLYHKLDAIGYGFFIPIFFIMVGANFDIKYVIQNPKSMYLLPALLISAYLVKILPALLLRINFTWKQSISAGFLLASKLSLIIATSEIGLKLNIISKEVNGIIILVAIITCTFSPLIFNKLIR